MSKLKSRIQAGNSSSTHGDSPTLTSRIAATTIPDTLIQPEVTLVGGLVHSAAMARALEQMTKCPIATPEMGQFAAALGAASLGYARLQKLSSPSLPRGDSGV